MISTDDMNLCMESEAVTYLAKPFDLDQLAYLVVDIIGAPDQPE